MTHPLTETLPPLPDPAVTSHVTDSVMRSHEVNSYSAAQMRDYGAACARASLAAPAQPTDSTLKLLGRYDQAQANLAQAMDDGGNVHGAMARVVALREELEAALAAPLVAPSEPEQPLGDAASGPGSLSLRSDDPYRSTPTEER